LTNETFASQELSGNDYFVVVKQTDESLANNTTLHDDVELKVTLDAHKVYSWEARIFTTADSSTPDIRWAMDAPAGATIRYNDFGWDSDQAFFTGDGRVGDEHLGGIGARETTFELHGYVIMGGTAGDLQFQWAQAESHVDNVTVNKGSSLKVWEEGISNIKTKDETLNNYNTLQNDDELLAALDANKVYSWEARIFTTADSSTPDIRWAMDVPAGATIRYNDFRWDSNRALVTGDARIGNNGIDIGARETTFELHGYVIMGGTARGSARSKNIGVVLVMSVGTLSPGTRYPVLLGMSYVVVGNTPAGSSTSVITRVKISVGFCPRLSTSTSRSSATGCTILEMIKFSCCCLKSMSATALLVATMSV